MAVTAHVPTPTPVTMPPLLTVQMVAEVLLLKVTALPEAPPEALAVVVPPTATVPGVKLMAPIVWFALPTVMFSVTGAAAR